METAATETRTNPTRLLTIALLTCLVALTTGVAAAQTAAITDAEMRYLRAEARATATPRSTPGFTQAELRDLRAEAKLHGGNMGGGPAFHGFTAGEIADLRAEAVAGNRPSAHHTGFSATELAGLRAEARIVVPRSSGPVRAFTESELHDLRKLAHTMQIDRQADVFTETR